MSKYWYQKADLNRYVPSTVYATTITNLTAVCPGQPGWAGTSKTSTFSLPAIQLLEWWCTFVLSTHGCLFLKPLITVCCYLIFACRIQTTVFWGIDVRPTTLPFLLTLTLDLNIGPWLSLPGELWVMTHTHAQIKVSWLDGHDLFCSPF